MRTGVSHCSLWDFICLESCWLLEAELLSRLMDVFNSHSRVRSKKSRYEFYAFEARSLDILKDNAHVDMHSPYEGFVSLLLR